MTILAETMDSQGTDVFDQSSFDDPFVPNAHFGEWLQAVETFRNRPLEEPLREAYLENEQLKFEDVRSFYDQLVDKISCPGTLSPSG